MGGITDNRIDWVFPTTPADAAKLSTAELAERERARQKQVADELLNGVALSIEDAGRDPYNAVGRVPRK